MCSLIRLRDWDYKWLEQEQVPFAFSNWQSTPPLRWSGFEDVRSIEAKTKYLLDMQLGGAAFISLDTDDYLAFCKQGEFPLLRVINHHLKKSANITFPDANMLYNLTWANEIYSREDSILRENYVPPSRSSSNASKYSKRSCSRYSECI